MIGVREIREWRKACENNVDVVKAQRERIPFPTVYPNWAYGEKEGKGTEKQILCPSQLLLSV
jgi:hypothetical protein